MVAQLADQGGHWGYMGTGRVLGSAGGFQLELAAVPVYV